MESKQQLDLHDDPLRSRHSSLLVSVANAKTKVVAPQKNPNGPNFIRAFARRSRTHARKEALR